jgi:hypothetical protein
VENIALTSDMKWTFRLRHSSHIWVRTVKGVTLCFRLPITGSPAKITYNTKLPLSSLVLKGNVLSSIAQRHLVPAQNRVTDTSSPLSTCYNITGRLYYLTVTWSVSRSEPAIMSTRIHGQWVCTKLFYVTSNSSELTFLPVKSETHFAAIVN